MAYTISVSFVALSVHLEPKNGRGPSPSLLLYWTVIRILLNGRAERVVAGIRYTTEFGAFHDQELSWYIAIDSAEETKMEVI